MKLNEILTWKPLPVFFPAIDSSKMPTRDQVIKKVRAAKTPEQKQKWARYLIKNRFSLKDTDPFRR